MSHQPSTSSGQLSSSGVVYAHPAIVKAVFVTGDGTHAATVIVYDNPSAASGNILAAVNVPATGTFALYSNSHGVESLTGVYVSIAGTGAAAVVHYLAKY